LFAKKIFDQKQHDVIPHPPCFSQFPWLNIKQRPPFLHNWCDWGRIAGGVEHPHRTQLPGCIRKWQKCWE
jgi:hypothetical protein